MRILHSITLTLLLTISQISIADELKVEGIDDIIVTPCITTKIKFNQNALLPFTNQRLKLKIEDFDTQKIFIEEIKQNTNGDFYWENAIPLSESLFVTIFNEDESKQLSYEISESTLGKLPIALKKSEKETIDLIRGTSDKNLNTGKNTQKILIKLQDKFKNKQVLALLVDSKGELLWQFYGRSSSLTAEIPLNSDYQETIIIPAEKICPL